MITPIGTIIKSITKSVGGGTVTPSGGLTTEYSEGGGEPEPPTETLRLKLSRFFHSLKDPDYK